MNTEEFKNIERGIFADLAKYVTSTSKKNKKFVIITKLPGELSRYIQTYEPEFYFDYDYNRRIMNFINGKSRIIISSLFFSGYDLGDKIGNDQRELILLPTFIYYSYIERKNIIARVYGRITNKSNPIITQIIQRDGKTFFISLDDKR